MDNPLTAELAEMARQVSEARAMIPRILPARPAADGKAVQPLVVGVPLAPVKGPFWRGRCGRCCFRWRRPPGGAGLRG